MDEDLYFVDLPAYGEREDSREERSNSNVTGDQLQLPVVPPPRSTALENDDENTAALAEIEDVPMANSRKSRKGGKILGQLNTQRLLADKGLPALDNFFSNVQFKEDEQLENLDKLLSTLEHWAHQMCPKLMFDDCLEKIEKLGQKREVKTYVKKLRSNDTADDEDIEEEQNENESDNDSDSGSMSEMKNNSSESRVVPQQSSTATYVDLYGMSSRSLMPDMEPPNQDRQQTNSQNGEEENQEPLQTELEDQPSSSGLEVQKMDFTERADGSDEEDNDDKVPLGFVIFHQKKHKK